MTNTIEKYGLRVKKTGRILTFYTINNEGRDFCGDVTYKLSDSKNDNMWLVDDPYTAEYVRNYSTEWYNAGHSTPVNDNYEPDELEVVKVKVETLPVEVSVPSMKEYLELKYKKSEPDYYRYMMDEIKSHDDYKYTLYDLENLINEGIWK